MMTLYHAPRTRSLRIRWLLEELGVPYQLKTVPFVPPSSPFSQDTPSGKFPTLEDDGVVLFESGAILEYVLERHGNGRLAPAPGTPLRGPFLQWVHFAEATAFPPLGTMAWHMLFRQDAEKLPDAMADYRGLAIAALDVLERALAGKTYLLGDALSGADVMMGYTLLVAKWFGLLADGHPKVSAYLARLEARPALQKALAD
jgi:glutathione S-transferase